MVHDSASGFIAVECNLLHEITMYVELNTILCLRNLLGVISMSQFGITNLDQIRTETECTWMVPFWIKDLVRPLKSYPPSTTHFYGLYRIRNDNKHVALRFCFLTCTKGLLQVPGDIIFRESKPLSKTPGTWFRHRPRSRRSGKRLSWVAALCYSTWLLLYTLMFWSVIP